jgi:signal transduction histidine kinase
MLGSLEDELAEQASPLPPARRERLEAAHRNSLRLLKLVNSLLDFSRIEAGRIQASYEATDLAAYTVELASVFRSAIEKAGLSLTINCPALPEPVYVDREMWEKIVLNLISNAFKHTFEGGISVKLRASDDHVELEVADSGVGIPAEALPRVFERFHRVKGSKSRTHEGTGIGLALVKELVALHGGAVQVESEENKGSRFKVVIKAGSAHLPTDRVSAKRELTSTATRSAAYVEEALHWLPKRTAPEAGNGSNSAQATIADKPLAADSKRCRILWADDNADMRQYVCHLLGDRYDVVPVPDGLKALAAAEADPPDLLLTDVMMPGMDGFALLRELRKNPRTKTIPVILLSARAGEESAIEGLDAGADDYLAKPFTARELLARVRTHLELARVRREWAKELEQANRELEASNKELEAFSYSVSHDLRGPLTTIQGFADLLLEKYAPTLGEQPQKYLHRISDAVTGMACLIDDLLKLSKVNRYELRLCDVSLGALVEEVLREMESETTNRNIEWRIDSLPVVHCDHGLVKQVFANLLSNAVKYTRPRDPAIIEVGHVLIGGEQVFLVQDNGVGFDIKNTGKLFTAFQRFHPAGDFEGTGIGLATVQRIISRHGGRIWAEAEVGKGATFRFTLGNMKSSGVMGQMSGDATSQALTVTKTPNKACETV